MIKTLFDADSYLKEFEAEVTLIDDEQNGIALSRTAFYPGGGGQPCDFGEINSADQSYGVLKTVRKNNQIWHLVDGELPPVGVTVQGVLDWERRYRLMRTHTALHILCGVIWRDYQAQVTGGNMEPLKGRLDFEFDSLTVELIREIEEKINREVQGQRTVRSEILPREKAFAIPDLIRTKVNLLPESLKEIRVVTIEDLDIQADGGTHVANTSEVGNIRITKHKSKGKLNKRIEISLDE